MLGWLANTVKVSASGFIMLNAIAGFAYAAGEQTQKKEETEAANSLKSVLIQAGEQGLIKVEDHDAGEKAPTQPKSHKPTYHGTTSDVDCKVSSVFDFSGYQDISKFEDVLETKTTVQSYDNVSDVMVLAKQYLSLGMGTEVVALARPYDTTEAKLLTSLGRIIDDLSTTSDIQIISAYKSCTPISGFWTKVAHASQEFGAQAGSDWNLSLSERKILLEMPEHLKSVLITRLGIHAGELELETLADQLLALIEPQSRRGLLPTIKDDDRLYLYALVRQMKGDPSSEDVLKHLGQADGVYRTRALLKLVKNVSPESQGRYDEFSADLLSVQQQYRGSAPARKASLEVVKHQVLEDQFIYAINLAKQEFSPVDPERIEAVNAIGQGIIARLQSNTSNQKLHALSSYMHDPGFFSKHENIGSLKSRAYEAAIGLNLPELALRIPKDIVTPSEEHSRSRHLAEAQMSYKRGDFDKTIELSKAHSDDARYQDLLMKSALKIKSQLVQAKATGYVPEGAQKTKLKADIALKNSRWDEARSALKTLADAETVDPETKDKLAIVDYVISNDTEQKNRANSDTVSDMETFNSEINADIDLVKAYLKNG